MIKKIYCWGGNRFGQLGNGSSLAGSYSSVPVEVKVSTSAFAGNTITCNWRNR
ncbi:hypothetical protein KOY48_04555 [Candidatus Minimicrobia naudis]|uniref:Uncharacterized protein n=1 Tax=Candidatus Minimicrobia naudis TaxID=2841263 RepID=A0A8F1MC08_9BACT|nr:hypothetical protein KOY48_04555 [Candidatus Minimicrobia naudis]